MSLHDPIDSIKGVGPQLQKLFNRLGIYTVDDLLMYYPVRYDDYSHMQRASELRPGMVSIEATIDQVSGRYVRRGLHVTEAIASDASGKVRLVWFNQPYRKAALKAQATYLVSGMYELSYQKFAIMNPSCELRSDFPVSAGRVIPIYRETKGLSSQQIRKVLKSIFTSGVVIAETLPRWLVAQQKLLPRSDAIETIHFPPTMGQLENARKRLAFEEVLELCLASLLLKQENHKERAISVPFDERIAISFVKHLPFALTDDQRRVIWQSYLDIAKQEPMNRLVQGDVGAGKTVVAAMIGLMVLQSGHQVALMAPTEVLARQHAETMYKLLKPLGYESQVCLLVGGMSSAQKKVAYKRITSGDARLIVGTHAIIQEKINLEQLGLVIIDEQHRFGVEQRQKLLQKTGHIPHLLSLTATPIPRSLSLTLYGELDISTIKEKPKDRKPIATQLFHVNDREKAYQIAKQEVSNGHQVFVVCPTIEQRVESSPKSVQEVYENLSKGIFKQARVALLHGQMKSAEKEDVMQRFVEGKVDVLVSTTVIEVGVDVSNATVMIIESAERFGLAQLHQLRGRVGRGAAQGHCLLLTETQQPTKRLRALVSSNDGFALAEFDLSLRGPGAIYGTSQHGALDLRIAKLSDYALLVRTKKIAQAMLAKEEDLIQYEHLSKQIARVRAVTYLN
ncbi:MAG TPA: ATP-dependent DNA helicase RecG [Candidatus Saccharibacteria bacterium]|nr:ATP-dependent DNA helicase RecG [Candidatus Saccharibacteria bacterium]